MNSFFGTPCFLRTDLQSCLQYKSCIAGVGNLFNTRAFSENVIFTGGCTADKAGSSRHKILFFSLKIREDQRKKIS